MHDNLKIALIVLVCLVGFVIGLCFSPEHTEPKVGISVKLKSDEVEIIKIRDCDYVFWENPRGLDMEHYRGCVNPAHTHTEFHGEAAKGMRLMWEDAE